MYVRENGVPLKLALSERHSEYFQHQTYLSNKLHVTCSCPLLIKEIFGWYQVFPDEKELEVWRKGMTAMAALPNVYVKLSPGWIRTKERQAMLKSLVRLTVELFGPNRCMVACNWHVNGAVSDADSMSEVGPDAVELLKMLLWFFEGYEKDQMGRFFAGTAKDFYRLDYRKEIKTPQDPDTPQDPI